MAPDDLWLTLPKKRILFEFLVTFLLLARLRKYPCHDQGKFARLRLLSRCNCRSVLGTLHSREESNRGRTNALAALACF